MEVQVCLKKSSFPEPLRDIERRHEIRFYERALDRLGHSEEAPCGLRRSRRRRCAGRPCCRRIEFGARQTQKASGLIGDIAKVDETTALADHVEEIAVFGRGGIGPMPGGARTGFWSAKPDEHRPARRVANVAHRPVAALPPPVAQVMAAYRLGLAGEAARQFGSVAGHHATSRGALALCCVEAVNRL